MISLFDTPNELVAASIGYVETRSALGAMTRTGRLRGPHRERARVELEEIWQDMNVVHLDDRLVGLAGDAAEGSRLRAGDAIHLTSALMVADPDLVFVTWDLELGRAAREAGLAVVP